MAYLVLSRYLQWTGWALGSQVNGMSALSQQLCQHRQLLVRCSKSVLSLSHFIECSK